MSADLKSLYDLRKGGAPVGADNPVDVQAPALGEPADAAWGGSGSGSLVALLKYVAAELASTLSVSAASLPLPAGAATDAKVEAVRALLAGTLTSALAAGTNLIGKVAPSADQDPIYDHTNGASVAVTSSSATAFTPPAGCKYGLFYASADTYIRTDAGAASTSNGQSVLIQGGAAPSVHPVVAATAIKAVTASTATLTFVPMKERA